MPRVYFKPITWYIEMHHVRTFFVCVASWLFALRDVHSQRLYLQEESLPWFLSAIELSAWPLFISWRKNMIRTNSERFFRCIRLDKRVVSFPLEDKLVVNEDHVIRKSHDATHKKMSSRGAFQCTTWLVWNKLATSKTLLWRRQKNSWVSQSTGKGNTSTRKSQKNPFQGRHILYFIG